MAEVILSPDMPAALAADVASTLADLGVTVRQPTAPAPPAVGPRGKVIVVISPKGGSGKTAVASNLAVALAQQYPGQVAAVDLDVQFGDLAIALSLRPEHTLAHLARSSAIDATTVKVLLTPYEPGLYVLCGAPTPEEADAVTHEHVAAFLPLLAEEFAFVVVDTPAGLDDRTLSAIEGATDLLFVSSLDVLSIRSVRKLVDTLEKLRVATPRHFVLNRADAQVGIKASDAAQAVGLPLTGCIASSREIPLAMNLGSPVVVTAPKSVVAKQIQQLARVFAPTPAPVGRRRWRR
jgi:pilus assembly protein CpaE